MENPNERARLLALLRRLTPREIELLRYRVSGWASVEIARELALPIDFARGVLGSVYDKLELTWDEQEPSLVTIARFGQLLPELAPPNEPPVTVGAPGGPDDLTRQLPSVPPGGQPLGDPVGPPPQPSGRALAMVDRDDEALLAQRAPVGSTAVLPPAGGSLIDDDEPVAARHTARADDRRDNTPLFVAGAAAIAIIALLLFLLFRAVGGDDGDDEQPTEVAGGGSTVEVVVPTEAATTPPEQPTETLAPDEPTPTLEPTEEPTEEPTATPTEEPTETPTEEPTATPTEEPTEEPTATPTEEPEPEPTPGPPPQGGALTYEANWDAGDDNWAVENGWELENGALVGDGEAGSLAAPFEPATANYAVEADLTILAGNDNCPTGVGVFSRRTQQSSAGISFDAGYVGAVCDDGWQLAATRPIIGVLDRLADGDFEPGDTQHTLRLEVNGTRLRLFINGEFIGEATDDRWDEAGEAGIYVTGDYRVRVSGFRVFELPAE